MLHRAGEAAAGGEDQFGELRRGFQGKSEGKRRSDANRRSEELERFEKLLIQNKKLEML